MNSVSQRSGHLIMTTLNSLTCNILKVLMAAVTDTNHYGLDQMSANDASIVSVTPFFFTVL